MSDWISIASSSNSGRARLYLKWLTKTVIKGKEEVQVRIGAGRRLEVRRAVLRFLTDAGLDIDRKLVKRPGKKDIRNDRAPIRWLTKQQAKDVAEKLPQPWADCFRVQVAMGLRPDELPTLKRVDFDAECTTLKLSPFEHLTLKEGSPHYQGTAADPGDSEGPT